MEFNRYQIPPNFALCQLHHQAGLIYDKVGGQIKRCPCCDRAVGSSGIPYCRSSQKLLKISEELPLFFSFNKAIIVVLIIFIFTLLGQYIFSRSYQTIKYDLELPNFSIINLQIGFVQKSREARFSLFLIFTLLIVLLRGYLKKIKYQAAFIIDKLSDRSVMLTNVHPQVTERDIRQQFEGKGIDHVVITYRVRDYHTCLVSIYHLQKEKIIARKKKAPAEQLLKIQRKINQCLVAADQVFRTFRKPQNKLDIAFITFVNSHRRNAFLQQYSHNLFGRLYYKFCTCCSSTAIHGRHITVLKAPQPEDIDWLNLQQRYWTKKIHRFACFYMCFAILIYGVLFQYQVSIIDYSSFEISIIKTVVIFVVDYFIIAIIDNTTYKIQKHELNTSKVISLVRKLTFFIFINLSMSPLAIYLYYQFAGVSPPGDVNPFDNLAFSVLTIAIGNIFKPLAQYFNFQRVMRTVNCYLQRRKQIKCQMTQQQANQAFEAIPFPIAAFYSLLISSFFMTAFFISCFQFIIFFQLVTCCALYVTSKYMLLKVCKEPTGLKNQIGVVCQRMLTTSIYVYWLGDKIMYYCIVEQQNRGFSDYILDFDGFYIAQLVIMGCVLVFSSTFVSWVSHHAATQEQIRDSLLHQMNKNANAINSYEQVNSIRKLQQQYKKILSE